MLRVSFRRITSNAQSRFEQAEISDNCGGACPDRASANKGSLRVRTMRKNGLGLGRWPDVLVDAIAYLGSLIVRSFHERCDETVTITNHIWTLDSVLYVLIAARRSCLF